LTTTDSFYQASGSSPPAAGDAALPPDLVDDLARFLAGALIADIRQYPNLAPLQPNHEATIESPSGHDRTDPPARQGRARQEHAADRLLYGPLRQMTPSPAASGGKSWRPQRGARRPSATRKEVRKLDKEAR
jgi:hypothetical protein